ncbi:MAG: DUF3987 domain-containing protein, partial [Acidobacteriota bacterium]|nr:DUF3987 domain-containing protein [Acidobacteriota bacterium]
DIAAWHFGFGVPEYKNKDQFPELRRRMAADLGLVSITTPSGRKVSCQTGEVEPEVSPEADTEAAAPDTTNVIAFPVADNPFSDDKVPSIDWRSILEPGTFLYDYLNTTSRFDLPDEYHFWCGIQILGTAAGKLVCLESVPDIHPNFFVCLLGPSGIGKSRAAGMAKALLGKALEYDHEEPDSTGTYLTPMPGSGESLLDIFSKPEHDPEDGKRILRHCSVRGLVSFNEMTALASKANRIGNTLKPALIELYDGDDVSQKSRTSGHITVKEPFCQVIATTQPRAIREVLAAADADSGFVNRWIFAVGPSRPLTAYYTERFDPTPLVAPLRRLRTWCGTGKKMHLSGEALAVWEKFFYSEVEPVKVASDDLPLLTRVDLTMFKLMLVFAINEKSDQPEVRHVKAAISLWPYLKASYALLAGEIGLGEVDACGQAVLDNIRRYEQTYKKSPSVSDLYRIYMKRRFTQEIILKSLRQLEALGQISELLPPVGSTGRPAVRYTVNG